MPLKLNVGITKKVGLPDYGSLGASCHLELDLDGSLVEGDLVGFHERVRRTYAACAQAVDEELARRQEDVGPPARQTAPPQSRPRAAAGRGAHGAGQNGASQNGATKNGHAARATTKQLDYAQQLAGQIRGLGVRRLETLSTRMFGKPVAELTSLDASGLIDALKEIKSGQIDLEAALSGAAA